MTRLQNHARRVLLRRSATRFTTYPRHTSSSPKAARVHAKASETKVYLIFPVRIRKSAKSGGLPVRQVRKGCVTKSSIISRMIPAPTPSARVIDQLRLSENPTSRHLSLRTRSETHPKSSRYGVLLT